MWNSFVSEMECHVLDMRMDDGVVLKRKRLELDKKSQVSNIKKGFDTEKMHRVLV